MNTNNLLDKHEQVHAYNVLFFEFVLCKNLTNVGTLSEDYLEFIRFTNVGTVLTVLMVNS